MTAFKITTTTREILADTVTPVSVYLRIRDIFPNAILLESSDYHGNENSYSFIGIRPEASITVKNNIVKTNLFGTKEEKEVTSSGQVSEALLNFYQSFDVENPEAIPANGLFGYVGYDGIQYFETLELKTQKKEEHDIPDIRYDFYKVIIAIDHHQNKLKIVENLREGEKSEMEFYQSLMTQSNFTTFSFDTKGNESSNISDEEYRQMVTKGKEHCFRGDVFQIVLSRQFSQGFQGDEFNVYRALRSINPSPYLFYFDYGSYKIFGSSPEAQLQIKENTAIINPIAGTFRRTGKDDLDRELAEKLSNDPKENAEHVMLVDLARNDLSRNCDNVVVDTYREVQYYSHVLHLVSQVSGKLPADHNPFQVFGDSFPAGTLSGAPKYKAMSLIDTYENQNRGFYGGCIGFIGFDGTFNHAIMIRSFLSKNHTLFYQAGAGVVSESVEESELQEVNNKLAALKNAIELAKQM